MKHHVRWFDGTEGAVELTEGQELSSECVICGGPADHRPLVPVGVYGQLPVVAHDQCDSVPPGDNVVQLRP